MRFIFACMIALGTFALAEPVATQAAPEYPWCANEKGASNCGFSTWEQCMATARGHGSCEPNPFYHQSRAQSASKRPRRSSGPGLH